MPVRKIAHTLAGVAAVAMATFTLAGEPWQRHTIDNTSRGADGVRLADFNGDGHLDVVTGWEEGGLVRVYQNPGPRKAKQPWPQVTVGKVASPEDAVFADLDGDSNLDVVSSCEGRNRAVYVHWAAADKAKYLDPASWKTEKLPASAGPMWMFCLPMQIDGRHGVDLVVGSKGEGASVGWFESPEDPHDLDAWKFHKLIDAGWIMSLQAHDMDGDGDSDIVLSDRKGDQRGVKWLANPGNKGVATEASWPVHHVGGEDQEVMFLAVHQYEKGHRKVGWASSRSPLASTVIAADGKPLHANRSSVELPAGCGTGKAVALCDVDLDGRVDKVFTCEHATGQKSGVRWLTYEGKTKREGQIWRDYEISGPEGVKFDRIEMVDLDGDGDLDLMTCEERANLGVIWYENPTR